MTPDVAVALLSGEKPPESVVGRLMEAGQLVMQVVVSKSRLTAASLETAELELPDAGELLGSLLPACEECLREAQEKTGFCELPFLNPEPIEDWWDG